MFWKEWFRQNSDKLILLVVWLVCLSFVWRLMQANNVPAETVSWAREAAGTVLGAILGLITGAALGSRGSIDSHTTIDSHTPAIPPEVRPLTIEELRDQQETSIK